MNKAVNITVAIPTLNRPAELTRCLESLLQGPVVPAEVLVIDQGEYQAVEQAIQRLRTEYSVPIIHCSQPRQGLSAARNFASGQARCPVIAFTDDDCVPDPAWLASIDHIMDAFPHIAGVTGSILPFEQASTGLFPISIRTRPQSKTFQGRTLPWHVGSGGNFAIKRNWLLQVRGYDERLGVGSPGQAAEDMDLFYRLLRAGAVIQYEPDVVVFHERQDVTRLKRSFWTYGYGVGAFSAKQLRNGDLYAAYILGMWLFWLIWRTGSSIVHRDRLYSGEALLSLGGCARGLVYGFQLRSTL
jgi:GT2 family glycosyltransferase